MRKISEIYTALINGDSMTDEEVIALRDQFKLAVDAVFPLGDMFRIAFYEASLRYLYLDAICKARGIE
jgi:hypothetical protein